MRSVVLVLQPDEIDPPGYLSEFLQRKRIDHVVLELWKDADAALVPSKVAEVLQCVPKGSEKPFMWNAITKGTALSDCGDDGTATACSPCGVVCLGGRHSANDVVAYYPHLFSLLRDCVDTRTPFMGHCLGAQLLCVALGGKVTKAPKTEYCWVDVVPEKKAPSVVKNWFLPDEKASFFSCHLESFSIPEGCHRVAVGEHCLNQAFQVGDQHIIGTQFHPEVTEDGMEFLIRQSRICPTAEEVQYMTPSERLVRAPVSVKPKEEMLETLPFKFAASKKFVDHMYTIWTEGLMVKHE